MAATAHPKQLSEEEREKIIEQARRELPELDRRFKKAMTNLNRISRGLRPKS
jgi:ribosomal protein L29